MSSTVAAPTATVSSGLAHITMVTLGVTDLARATEFYKSFGFERSAASQDGISFMNSRSIVLGLFPVDELSKDANVDTGKPGQGAVALAQNHASREDVDTALVTAVAAGGTVVKPAQEVFWGGYSGYFTDPDGHLWEVAHNPFATLDEQGCMQLPGSEAAS